ncbi:DUF4294 domain-containing protein [Tenacibaculum maritimum]|uniref:DUF4294 domain-containing protein n=1 Tax=Tenacibaculum maritimum TaxID=107401 RepID=UPI003877312D
MKNILYIYVLLLSISSKAQIKDTLPNFKDDYYLVKDGDTLMIQLEEISVLPRNKFKSQEDLRYYYWFKRKVFKAYPYAKLASQRLDSLNNRLNRITSKRKRSKYVRRVQDYVEGEFTDQIKKMTRTEGRILIKLIHRQTGKTVFDNIKQLRSGWKAFWYNTTANIFKLSLKSEYHPEQVNEDYLIENILQRAFRDEKLEEQEPKLIFKPMEILTNKRGNIEVSAYKEMFSKMRRRSKKKKK